MTFFLLVEFNKRYGFPQFNIESIDYQFKQPIKNIAFSLIVHAVSFLTCPESLIQLLRMVSTIFAFKTLAWPQSNNLGKLNLIVSIINEL